MVAVLLFVLVSLFFVSVGWVLCAALYELWIVPSSAKREPAARPTNGSLANPEPIPSYKLPKIRKQHLERFLAERVTWPAAQHTSTFRVYGNYLEWCRLENIPERERYCKRGMSMVLGGIGVRHGRRYFWGVQMRALLNFELN